MLGLRGYSGGAGDAELGQVVTPIGIDWPSGTAGRPGGLSVEFSERPALFGVVFHERPGRVSGESG